MIDYKEILNSLTTQDVINIMNKLGSDVRNKGTTSTGAEYLQFRTICHGGDSDKLYYYIDSKSFYCYTSCGFMGFYECIQKILGIDECNFYGAVEYVAKFLGYREDEEGFSVIRKEDEDVEEFSRIREMFRRNIEKRHSYEPLAIETSSIGNTVYSNFHMACFDHSTFCKDWIDEGISEDVMRKFNISWNWFDCSIIIPHYDRNGNLIGIRRRTFYQKEIDNGRKYTPLNSTEGYFPHELGSNLYGIYENIYQKADNSSDIIEKNDIFESIKSGIYSAVIFEGEKSVLKLKSCQENFKKNMKNATINDKTLYKRISEFIPLASCGFNITQKQINLLKDLGFRRIYIAFDKDFDPRKRKTEYKDDEVLKFNYRRYIEKIEKVYQSITSGRAGVDVRILIDAFGKPLLGEKDSPIDCGIENFIKLVDESDSMRDTIEKPTNVLDMLDKLKLCE